MKNRILLFALFILVSLNSPDAFGQILRTSRRISALEKKFEQLINLNEKLVAAQEKREQRLVQLRSELESLRANQQENATTSRNLTRLKNRFSQLEENLVKIQKKQTQQTDKLRSKIELLRMNNRSEMANSNNLKQLQTRLTLLESQLLQSNNRLDQMGQQNNRIINREQDTTLEALRKINTKLRNRYRQQVLRQQDRDFQKIMSRNKSITNRVPIRFVSYSNSPNSYQARSQIKWSYPDHYRSKFTSNYDNKGVCNCPTCQTDLELDENYYDYDENITTIYSP